MRALLVGVVLASTLALADPLPARDTATVGPRGAWSVGVFNPLRIAIHDRIELQANPLLFLVAPHLDARFALIQSRVRLTLDAGVSVPTFALRLAKGYFFPTWATSENDIGWMLIPRVGLILSGEASARDEWTLRADTSLRVALSPHSASALNSFLIPLDLVLAAPLTGSRSRLGGAYDHAFTERLRLRGELNLYLTGPQGHLVVSGKDVGPLTEVSPFIVTAHLGLDFAVFQHSRITVGVLWANADQGGTAVTTGRDGFSDRVRVRGNNFLPTLDYIWAGF